ncbi:MAG: YihY/virulence factor BrkB family protein [Balneolaceae bacterium]
MKTIAKNIKTLATTTLNKAIEDDIVTQGAAIAFYTIFSIAPLFILIIAVSGFFSSEELITGQIEEQLTNYLGRDAADNLVGFIDQQSDSSASIWTSILATGVMIFGATTVISQLKATLNTIWKVREVRIGSVWGFVWDRLISFGVILLISTLLVSALLVEGLLGVMSSFFQGLLPDVPFDFYMYVSQAVTLCISVLFFTLIFKILPDVHARWKDVIVGAAVTTLLFILGKYLIGFYLSATDIQATYRAAGTLVVFVIWVYYNIQTILLGAVFTQVYTEKFGGRILPYSFVVMETTGRRTSDREKSDEPLQT